MKLFEQMKNELNEGAAISPMDKWAVCSKVELNWGGDVDFSCSKYSVRTLISFAKDKKLHAKLREVLMQNDTDYSPKLFDHLEDPIRIGKLFRVMYKQEAYSAGIDAMPELDYKDAKKQAKED